MTRQRKILSKRRSKKLSKYELSRRAKSARSKGYAVERDTVNYFRSLGAFALRIPTRSQRKSKKYVTEYQRILQPIDLVVYYKGIFWICQAKRYREYLHAEEKGRILLAKTQFGSRAFLSYRQRGLKFEEIDKDFKPGNGSLRTLIYFS